MTLKPTLAGALGAILLFATPALSHASLEEQEATIGSTYKGVMRITHGCDGKATHTVRIDIPDGFYAVKPMPKAGWTLETVIGAYETPYVNHGTEMTEGVRQIIWSGGDLHDDWYDEFTFRGSLGKDAAPGPIYFPTVQLCEGAEEAWTDTSGATDVANPAPKLTLVAGVAVDEHAGHLMASEIKLGDLTISAPFARATLPNAPVAGGFMTITNSGSSDDTLIGATSDIAGVMQVHEMVMDGDTMKMRELQGGLVIPAGATVALAPGGYHIMFMDLKGALVEGETVNVTLTFEHAGSVEVPLAIGARDAKAAMGEHDGQDGHDGMAHGTEHAGTASHSAPGDFDQAAIEGDAGRIDGLLRATFETHDSPLTLNPVLIEGDRAIVGWIQGEMGGRALLERDAAGLWRVALCAGDGLKGQANMEAMGLSVDVATKLAAAQAEAESKLDAAAIAKLDSFGEPVHFE